MTGRQPHTHIGIDGAPAIEGQRRPSASVPVVLHVTRYRCPFCTRSRAKKAATEQHIARCWHNPEVRACKTCVHYEGPMEGPYPEHPGWAEGCAAECDITAGLRSTCPLWQAREDTA